MATEGTTRRFWRTFGFFIVLLVGTQRMVAAADSAPPSEYTVKAAFLFNFAKFVSWPPPAFSSPDAPIVIGILGDDPFGGEITRLAADVRVQGRPLVVKHGTAAADLADCHVIFFARSEDEHLAQWFRALRERHSVALTVGESDDFISVGGMIRFVVSDRKVRFEIEPETATAARLTISSKLLRLALNQRQHAS